MGDTDRVLVTVVLVTMAMLVQMSAGMRAGVGVLLAVVWIDRELTGGLS